MWNQGMVFATMRERCLQIWLIWSTLEEGGHAESSDMGLKPSLDRVMDGQDCSWMGVDLENIMYLIVIENCPGIGKELPNQSASGTKEPETILKWSWKNYIFISLIDSFQMSQLVPSVCKPCWDCPGIGHKHHRLVWNSPSPVTHWSR